MTSTPPPAYYDIYGTEENLRNKGAISPEPVAVSFWMMSLNLINGLTQFCLGAVVLAAFLIADNDNNGRQLMTWDHIYMCVTGYMILMSQAVLSFNPRTGWAHNLNTTFKRMIHGGMQVAGSLLGITGCIYKITDTNMHYYPNKPHAIAGWITMVLTFLSLIGGIVNVINPEKVNLVRLKNPHKYLGALTITAAFVCLCLGFNDNSFFDIYASVSVTLCISFTVIALVGILIFTFFGRME